MKTGAASELAELAGVANGEKSEKGANKENNKEQH